MPSASSQAKAKRIAAVFSHPKKNLYGRTTYNGHGRSAMYRTMLMTIKTVFNGDFFINSSFGNIYLLY
jgi:hypothetical protein